jgi:hypothetical protein
MDRFTHHFLGENHRDIRPPDINDLIIWKRLVKYSTTTGFAEVASHFSPFRGDASVCEQV